MRCRRAVAGLRARVGGSARLRAVTLLAAVLALNSADAASIGAVAAQLEPALHIGNARLGLLLTASTGVAAVVTLPIGLLVDRVHRVRLLTAAVAVWSLAMATCGVATSYSTLLLTRLALGAVAATAAPVIASLTGDLFPAAHRARIYGYVLTGELVGAAAGILVAGNVSAWLSWRAAFWVLAAAGLVLAVALLRMLPEPPRGAQTATAAAAGVAVDPVIREQVEARDVAPREQLVVGVDPRMHSLWWAVRHVLAIPTNRVLILASALGYFFFAGVRTFAVVFVRGRFDLGQSAATGLLTIVGLGAVLGVLVTGRVADRMLGRGRLAARPAVAGASLVVAVVLFVPALLTPSLLPALVLFGLAAAGVGGANPPLDAARLDIVHFGLWGRAESVRTVLRASAEAVAPLLFGYVTTLFGGTGSGVADAGTRRLAATGVGPTYLIMLVPLTASALLLLLVARRSYPRDVATALASEGVR